MSTVSNKFINNTKSLSKIWCTLWYKGQSISICNVNPHGYHLFLQHLNEQGKSAELF